MKKTNINKINTETYTIDYENGIYCDVRLDNDSLTRYRFYNDNFKLTYLTDEQFEHVSNTFWNNLNLGKDNLTLNDLENFKEFDKLYYVGGGSDGMFRKQDGTSLTTPILLYQVFCAIYLDIETSKKECEDILKTLDEKYILSSVVEYIPEYNHNDEKDDHYTIRLMIKLNQEEYEKIMDGGKYLDDQNKIKAFNLIKKN